MAAKENRSKTGWWCLKCRRELRHDLGRQGPKDTVSPRGVRRPGMVEWKHDGCGGQVVAGG